ncbi:MAG TPA: hypothetical protein VLT59_14860, partial [Steroidobacteraceae bacterium]|nr:hypothetical protein [Steroidobacteraceae bacterium]
GRYDRKRFPGVEIRTLFHELPAIDFSRDVLMHAPTRLSALSVEDCGLCDLGTPARIADTLRRAGVPVVDQGQAGSRTPDLALAVTAGGHERRVS